MLKNKKAFTLTEMLVVVVLIGILSAVALPKFSGMLESRKTSEAEELMAVIRSEQEYRCTADRTYATDFNSLSQRTLQSNNDRAETSNFTYRLQGSGMSAVSKGKYHYTLKMPSYADGRLCCEGSSGDCEKLTKPYPKCNELENQGDFRKAPTTCTVGD